MLTRASLRHQEESLRKSPTLKKGNCVFISGKVHIIVGVLEAGENTTYNICDENLLNPKFGVKVENPEIIPVELLSETIRRKVIHFI